MALFAGGMSRQNDSPIPIGVRVLPHSLRATLIPHNYLDFRRWIQIPNDRKRGAGLYPR